jgi:hypothetical protein
MARGGFVSFFTGLAALCYLKSRTNIKQLKQIQRFSSSLVFEGRANGNDSRKINSLVRNTASKGCPTDKTSNWL